MEYGPARFLLLRKEISTEVAKWSTGATYHVLGNSGGKMLSCLPEDRDFSRVEEQTK